MDMSDLDIARTVAYSVIIIFLVVVVVLGSQERRRRRSLTGSRSRPASRRPAGRAPAKGKGKPAARSSTRPPARKK